MNGPICYCNHCGAVFQSRMIAASNSTNITFQGCSETCVRCGKMANIADGTFNFVNDMVEIVSAPQFTKDLLNRFLTLISAPANQAKSADEIAKESAQINPRFEKIIHDATKAHAEKGGLDWRAIVIVALLTAIGQCSAETKLDVNQALDQLRAASSSKAPPKAP